MKAIIITADVSSATFAGLSAAIEKQIVDFMRMNAVIDIRKTDMNDADVANAVLVHSKVYGQGECVKISESPEIISDKERDFTIQFGAFCEAISQKSNLWDIAHTCRAWIDSDPDTARIFFKRIVHAGMARAKTPDVFVKSLLKDANWTGLPEQLKQVNQLVPIL